MALPNSCSLEQILFVEIGSLVIHWLVVLSYIILLRININQWLKDIIAIIIIAIVILTTSDVCQICRFFQLSIRQTL